MVISTELIAKVCHEVNRSYCSIIGDSSQPCWAEAPEWQRRSAEIGVAAHLSNPSMTAEDSHKSWLAVKESEGWVWGPVKDAEKKEHPCMVPYSELPATQQAKDHFFKAIVSAFS